MLTFTAFLFGIVKIIKVNHIYNCNTCIEINQKNDYIVFNCVLRTCIVLNGIVKKHVNLLSYFI